MKHFTDLKQLRKGPLEVILMMILCFPVPGLTDSDETGVRRGRLRVTGHKLRDLFLPVLRDIYKLVVGQI